MQQSWNKVEVREAKLEADPAPRLEDSSGFAMREAIAKLRLTSSPVQFWLAMMNELPRGATADQKESHLLFCKTAADISRALSAIRVELSVRARRTSRGALIVTKSYGG